MTVTVPRAFIRNAAVVSAVAIAATVFGASSPIAFATPASAASTVTSLDNPANWAIVKEAAANGYPVPANLWANCGIDR